jgi:hypothetical protein
MKTKSCFFILAFLLGLNVFSQVKLDNILIENRKYPKASVNNFIHWLGLTTMEWENEMKQFRFSDRGLDEGCVYYGSGADLTDAVYSISKCPDARMSAEWATFGINKSTKLDDIVNELEPFYNKTDENQNNIYAFKHEGFAYHFIISRSSGGEFVIVTKSSIEN